MHHLWKIYILDTVHDTCNPPLFLDHYYIVVSDLCFIFLDGSGAYAHNMHFFELCRPVTDLISIPSLNIFRLNMLELGMLTWADCKFLPSHCASCIFCCFYLFLPRVYLLIGLLLNFEVNGQWISSVIVMPPILATIRCWPILQLLKMNQLEESATILCRLVYLASYVDNP